MQIMRNINGSFSTDITLADHYTTGNTLYVWVFVLT